MKVTSTASPEVQHSLTPLQLANATGFVSGSIIAQLAAGGSGGEQRAGPAPLTAGAQPAGVAQGGHPVWQQLLANNDRVADGFNLLSTTIDFVGEGSDLAVYASPLADGLAFSANGLSLAAKLDKEDYWGAAAAGIKLTGTVVSLAENYVFPGNTALTTAAGALKIGGMVVGFIAPEKPEQA